jgi:hypothetical protein
MNASPMMAGLPLASVMFASSLVSAQDPGLVVGDPLAYEWAGQQILQSVAGADEGSFGQSVAVAGDWLAVGGDHLDLPQGTAGGVLLHRRVGDSWVFDRLLQPENPALTHGFGNDVAMEADLLVVGATKDNTHASDSGAVFVFTFDGQDWVQQAKLFSPNPALGEHFGEELEVHGGNLFVGMPNENHGLFGGVGRVYEFREEPTGWQLVNDIRPAVPLSTQDFGESIEVANGHLLISSREASGNVIHVFTPFLGSWIEQASIPFPGLSSSSLPRERLAFDGQTIAVCQSHPASVGLYVGSGADWSLQDEIPLPAGCVDVSGDLLLIGRQNDATTDQVATLHRRVGETWVEVQTFAPATPLTPDVSADVLVLTDQFVVISDSDSTAFPSPGLVFTLNLEPGPWNEVGPGIAGTGGEVPVLLGDGPLVPGTSGAYRLSHALPGADSWLVASFALLGAPFKGGLLVPFPDLLVGPVPVTEGGTLDLPFDWLLGSPAGLAFYAQMWAQDPGAVKNLSASNGLQGIGQ